jgi:hypothetical protein
VATFARSLSLPAGLRSVATRRLALALGSMTALAVSLLLAAAVLPAPAGAHVVELSGAKFGVQRHSAPPVLFESEGLEPQTFTNASGSPVLHQSSPYVIFWDPEYHYLDPWVEVIDQFFQNMSTASGSLASVFAVDTQYTDKTNKPAFYRSAFRGSYSDKAPYPSPEGCKDPEPLGGGDAITCLSDKQVREQLESFIAREGLPKGMGTIYYLLTPPGVTVCTDEGASASHCSSKPASANSFCSYHAAITPTNPTTGDANTVLYGVIPWTAGGLGDPLLSPSSQTPAYDCQDGGFDPSSKPGEEKEKAKVDAEAEEEKRRAEEAKKRAGAEEEEDKEMTTYEEAFKNGLITKVQRELKEKELTEHRTAREKAEKEAEIKAAQTEKEAREKKERLEGPHQQEPNQASCPNVYDGGCDTGLADIIITQIGSEQQDIITDPLLNAWQDKNHNEVVDECRNVFALVSSGAVTANEESSGGSLYNQTLGAGNYYLNDAFNAAALRIYQPGGGCLDHVNLVPSFTAPTPVNSGEIVGLNGLESNIALNAAVDFRGGGAEKLTYATYAWNFGDGSPEVSGFAPGAPPCTETPWLSPCAASVFHSYKYRGIYPVTLTVTDVGGNKESVTHSITVEGESPPPPAAGAAGAAGSGQTTAITGPAASSAPATRSVASPVAAAAVVSRSLKTALRKGLVVRYSVNEQVTGRFEVLLDRTVARRLGITDPAAIGLPAGAPPLLVVAKAILVTTKGGRSTVEIRFSPRTAARLRRVHKVTLMLRMVVRNASSRSPASTTVLSTVTLSG